MPGVLHLMAAHPVQTPNAQDLILKSWGNQNCAGAASPPQCCGWAPGPRELGYFGTAGTVWSTQGQLLEQEGRRHGALLAAAWPQEPPLAAWR